MYRSTLCSYFHIILSNIMQIKFKHILLLITICFLIYLEYNWFMSIDFSTVNFESQEDISEKANNFVAIHLVVLIVISLLLILLTNIEKHIIKLLNKNIFKL